MNNKLFLKFPDINDKNNYIKYQKEEHNIDLNYEEWLDNKIKSSTQEGVVNGMVPRTILILTDINGIIYGQCSIRYSLDNPDLISYKGNIGYEIKSNYRGHKLGNLILKLALEYCKTKGLNKVMISCKDANVASAKVIENNNGVFDHNVYISKEQANYKIYWINL